MGTSRIPSQRELRCLHYDCGPARHAGTRSEAVLHAGPRPWCWIHTFDGLQSSQDHQQSPPTVASALQHPHSQSPPPPLPPHECPTAHPAAQAPPESAAAKTTECPFPLREKRGGGNTKEHRRPPRACIRTLSTGKS